MNGQSGGHHKFSERSGGEINLIDYYRVLKKYYKMIAVIVTTISLLAVVWSLTLTNIYKVDAVIIPVSSKGGGAFGGLSTQFGGLASLAGILPGGTNDAAVLVAILESRTLAENVIAKENLIPVLFKELSVRKSSGSQGGKPKETLSMEGVVAALKGLVMFVSDKRAGTIKVSVKYYDADVAARIANAYLSELEDFLGTNAFTNAKKHRVFMGQQLEQNKVELLEIGKEIDNFYQRYDVSSTRANLNVTVGEQRLKALAAQDLDSLIWEKQENDRKINEMKIVKEVPHGIYLGYLLRQKGLLQEIQVTLSSQYEMAKIQESKEELRFTVIDSAVPLKRKISPVRSQICIMSFFVALFGAVFLAFVRDYLVRLKARS